MALHIFIVEKHLGIQVKSAVKLVLLIFKEKVTHKSKLISLCYSGRFVGGGGGSGVGVFW